MKDPERILVWLLRLGGVVMLTALAAVVMPHEWMNAIHRQAGLGVVPHVPIVGYLTRSLSAFYALHGALLIFLARDVRRYLPVIQFLAAAAAVFGAVMLGLDFAVGMPLLWTIAEGPFVLLLGVVILWLCWRVHAQQSIGSCDWLRFGLAQKHGPDRPLVS
jgi:hypothetical protein